MPGGLASRLAAAAPVAAATVAVLALAGGASAHDSRVSGFGAADLDGRIAPAEWADATRVAVRVRISPAEGGGTAGATAFVMNDGSRLYVGFRVARRTSRAGTLALSLAEAGEEFSDRAIFVGAADTPFAFADEFRGDCPANWCDDVGEGGTTDGRGAARMASRSWTVELAKALDSTDDRHDVSVGPGDRLRLSLVYQHGQAATFVPDIRYAVAGAPVRCVVPRLRGKTIGAARRALTQSHCALGKVSFTYASRLARGRIASQSPRPGARRQSGALVNVVVSRGRRP